MEPMSRLMLPQIRNPLKTPPRDDFSNYVVTMGRIYISHRSAVGRTEDKGN